MLTPLDSIMQPVRLSVRKFARNPKAHAGIKLALNALAGFLLSAASLGNAPLPLAMGFVCALNGFSSLASAAGACLGYILFWGNAGYPGVAWALAALAATAILSRFQQAPFLRSAVAAFLVSAAGVAFQMWLNDSTPIPLYLLRVALAGASCEVFFRVLAGRNPILEWIAGLFVLLALGQVAPTAYLNLGFLAGGIFCVAGAFPAVAMGGIALDLAGISPVSITAVMCASYLLRFFPRCPKSLSAIAPTCTYILVMLLQEVWDYNPIPPLLIGGIIGQFVPSQAKLAHHRGETGAAQVRLELAAGVLGQTQQILLEVPVVPVDENALVTRAAEQACRTCSCRKGCKDAKRIALLPGLLLHKNLHSTEELPIVCRKSGRFLAELHRAQEQLRSIWADRERQREYRTAVVQQYGFLSEFLQSLSDKLSRKGAQETVYFTPDVQIYGNRASSDNGDRTACFAGTEGKYYVLLCDGMGSGMGAVQEGRTAVSLLTRLLRAGFPAENALQSLNSLCALRERAGAVTVDLLEIMLTTGKATLYKWGAAGSFLVRDRQVQLLGAAAPPPGLSVTVGNSNTQHLSLRYGEILLLVSDGIGQQEGLSCCQKMVGATPAELAIELLSCGLSGGQDDATVITVQLKS